MVSSAYDRFMQEPYRATNRSDHLHHNGSNFAEWVASINRVLCIALNTELLVDNLLSSLENRSPQENRAISHFIDAMLPPDFALCIGIVPAHTTAKEFFDAIKERCCPGNRFQKLKVVKDVLNLLVENGAGQPKPNSAIILSLCKSFVIFKKLGIDADELEGFLAQAACHTLPSLDRVAFDQLVTSAILAKGDENPSSTFVGQTTRHFIQAPVCPTLPNQWGQPAMYAAPLNTSCFHCGRTGHWQANCPHKKGLTNPNPRPVSPGLFRLPCPGTLDRCSQNLSSPNYQREWGSQVKFVEGNASDHILIDTSASIHLSGSARFATNLKDVAPFCIFFSNSNSLVTISQTTTLKIPIKNGSILVKDVPFSMKILGTILSVGRLCRAGVVPIFSAFLLLLIFCNVLLTTSFLNDCWWVDVVPGEGTIVLAAETSSPCLFEMNPVSLPQSTTLSSREWNEQLGHACDKVVLSFLKQHVPNFDTKSQQTFYCKVCAKLKSTHWLAKTGMDIPKDRPLDLLGPFEGDAQGFQYLLTIHDHVSTYCVVYPLKLQSDAPAAILETIKQLQVPTGITPKALRTDDAKEFTSATFTNSLTNLGVAFYLSLPYSPQENGKAECLNQTLGDMVRAMVTQSQMPARFWQFAYASASFMHNRIPNSWCLKSSPHQELLGQAPSITMLYPHGANAVVHQQGKLAPGAIECKLLKPLMMGGLLLWVLRTNKMIQSASVIFPKFQPYGQPKMPSKCPLSHIVSVMTLGEVLTEKYFEEENQAIDSLPLVKDVKIPSHLGEALKGPHRNDWKRACEAELTQMATRDVWDVVEKVPGMKKIGHWWVFDLKSNANGSIKNSRPGLLRLGTNGAQEWIVLKHTL
ncbi:hypothetical protein O181_006844 [Austropuccinia psidii MF-1]|uniref:Integrase catalytic domain-containing protein n=1 Tax=Austropuccinia psidii MF-1 TaxID=1389203 RepID=A0A9Q3BJW9_9BASI|nr:hypothetical protein [Austropuccinia psidii MF-1]